VWYRPVWRRFQSHAETQCTYSIGCDIFAPYLKAIPNGIYDDLVCCDIAHLPFRDKAFSGAVAVEVIEHLDKIRGARALKEFERVSCRIIGLSTPKGYRIRSCEDGNPFQSHLSGLECK
jgi:hypothetical protein